MNQTVLFQRIKRMFGTACVVTGLTMCAAACSGEEAIMEIPDTENIPVQSENLPAGWKTTAGKMQANLASYEGVTRRVTTEESTDEWPDGSKIYFMIESGQKKVPVVAVYSSTFATWSFCYDASAEIPASGTMKGCYLEGATESSFTEATLSEEGIVYIDAKASYTYQDETFAVTVNLKPSYVRLRFVGMESQGAVFQGMNYVSHFDAQSYTFEQEPIIKELIASESVDGKYYTPYVYGYLNADQKIYLTTGGISYGRTLASGSLQAGESGWMTMPAENYIPKGWSVQTAPSLADHIVWGSGVTDEQKTVITQLARNMVYVSGGTFTMGATSEQLGANSDEKPAHTVTLTSGYYMGETEVTQELYQAVMGSNPSSYSGTQKPVTNVSWNDCQTFITKLNNLTGLTFRLPTEGEWEYAARGGNKSKGYLYSGSNMIDAVAYYDDNRSGSGPTNVKSKSPNELGLYDMSGNVWEWCQDWYGSYSSSAQTDPTGPTSGSGRVLRGGSWYDNAADCRVARRYSFTPSYTYSYVGFRLVLSISH